MVGFLSCAELGGTSQSADNLEGILGRIEKAHVLGGVRPRVWSSVHGRVNAILMLQARGF